MLLDDYFENNIIIQAQHTPGANCAYGYPASNLVFRASNASNDIWNVGAIQGVVDPFGGSYYQGGLVFLTKPSANDCNPIGRKTQGGPLVPILALGQNASNTRIAYFNSSVGIGTASPAEKFVVSETTNPSQITLKQEENFNSGIIGQLNYIGGGSGYKSAMIESNRVGGSASNQNRGADLRFYTKADDVADCLLERMRITNAGITCFSNTICAKSLFFSSNSTGQITFGANDACNAYIVSDSSNNLFIGNNNSYKILIPRDGSDMVFRTAATYANPIERMRITSGGSLLTWNTVEDVYDTNVSGNVKGYWTSQFSTENGTSKTLLGAAGTTEAIVGFASLNSSSKYIITAGIYGKMTSSTAGAETGDLVFYTKPSASGMSSNERMRITSGGSVVMQNSICIASGTLYLPGAIGGRTAQIEFGNSGTIDILGMPNQSSSFYLKYGCNSILFTNDSGGEILRMCCNRTIAVNGPIVPTANGTIDLGTSSLRWCTVYTSDLSLSNGIGDYTMVEGENDLFLYNNKQCKVYRFMLQEVCPEIAPAKRSI